MKAMQEVHQMALDFQTRSLLALGKVDRTLATVSKMSPALLARTFDSHLVAGITSEYVDSRVALDESLRYLGLIEIGIQCGCASVPRDERLLMMQDKPEIRRYMRDFYPQLVPQLLLDRVAGGNAVPSGGLHPDVFAAVLALNGRLDGERIARFLDAVDDYVGDDVPSLHRVLRALRKPGVVQRCLSGDVDEESTDEVGCAGFLEFIEWCHDLLVLLESSPNDLLRSTIWHQFGYWFRVLGPRMYGVLATALDGARQSFGVLASVAPDGAAETAEERDVGDMGRALDAQLEAFQLLTSSIYAAPLEAWRLMHGAGSWRGVRATGREALLRAALTDARQRADVKHGVAAPAAFVVSADEYLGMQAEVVRVVEGANQKAQQVVLHAVEVRSVDSGRLDRTAGVDGAVGLAQQAIGRIVSDTAEQVFDVVLRRAALDLKKRRDASVSDEMVESDGP